MLSEGPYYVPRKGYPEGPRLSPLRQSPKCQRLPCSKRRVPTILATAPAKPVSETFMTMLDVVLDLKKSLAPVTEAGQGAIYSSMPSDVGAELTCSPIPDEYVTDEPPKGVISLEQNVYQKWF